MSPASRSAPLPRVVIEDVAPQIDGGRHPVKRLLGDVCRVEADVFKDGHDLLAALVRFRGPGGGRWRSVPLRYRYDPDRWFGEFRLDRIGRWQLTVEAWPDRWGSWRDDLRKRDEAGQELRGELAEGSELLRRYAHHASGARGEGLREAARRLSAGGPSDWREVAFSDAVAELASGPIAPEELTRYERTLEVVVDRERAGFGAWYELFPRSQSPTPDRAGTFADAERRLPELAELGFDVIYLPPIHPIGRTHRKGPNNSERCGPDDPGSPWAIGAEEGGHTAVNPALGTLEDFDHFVAAAKSLGLEVALDYALQCSPDHPWAKQRPDWFYVRPDGSIRYAENPPKRYQDIYPLNFWCADHEGLWNACVDVLRFWIDHGVRIFRVDNPHTKPFAFWEWAIREIQRDHPDVIFFAEAFTRPKRMYGLAKLGFTQSYTYFTWKNHWWELRDYMTELTSAEVAEYFRPNFFTNTPDILHEYLQKGGRPAFRVRLLLAATLSPTYGIYSGFELCENVPVREGSEEYLDSEKYQIRWRDWDTPGHIKDDIRVLNAIRRESPALRTLANLSLLVSENEQILWYRKSAPGEELLIAVNLDPLHVQEAFVHVPVAELGLTGDAAYEVEDLLSGERSLWRGERNYVRLDPSVRPGHVLRVRGARSE